MFAVIEIGATQAKVAEGDLVETDRLEEKEGKSINLDNVLLFAKGSDIRIGQPYLKNVKVTAKVVNHFLGKKVTAFKFRKRKDSSTKNAHRQKLTTLSIEKIAA